MEIKIWEVSYSRQDLESEFGKAISDGEWNIIVDELYNNDALYELVHKNVMGIVGGILE
jgi:hypothetical protein